MANKKNEPQIYVGLRACSGYNPLEHLIDMVNSKTGEMGKYLLVPDRVTWFNAYCHEKGIEGVIDDSQVEFYPEINMFKAVCVIYMDGKEISRSTGSGIFKANAEDIITRKAVECAATSAKGRALANCGFGSNMSIGDDPEETPVDSPIVPQGNNPVRTPEKQPTDKKKAVQLPVTLDEAQQITIDFGEHKGKTLGEITALNMEFIEWLATKYNPSRHPEYKAAAEIILKNK